MTAEAEHRIMILTPPGTGAIGVIRVSGPRAAELAGRVFRASSPNPADWARTAALVHGVIVDGDEEIDDVLIGTVDHRGGRAADICTHGGVRVMERVVAALERAGARLIEADTSPGEAWTANDLIEAEADDALGRARTDRAVRLAAHQRASLPGAIRSIAAVCVADPSTAARRLEALLAGARAARTVLDGATVALIGPPNSGKSTLLNRFAGRTAAVPSPVAGTTRDWVTADVEWSGVPIRLVDTAGTRDAEEALEAEAVAAGCDVAHAADLRILLLDGSQSPAELDLGAASAAQDEPMTLITLNKADLAEESMDARSRWAAVSDRWISAETGSGVEELVGEILALLGVGRTSSPRPVAFTLRQERLIGEVLSDLSTNPARAARRLETELLGAGR